MTKPTATIPYPETTKEVDEASYAQICAWFRFLPSPETQDQMAILDYILCRFEELGGMTPEISKKLGWERDDD